MPIFHDPFFAGPRGWPALKVGSAIVYFERNPHYVPGAEVGVFHIDETVSGGKFRDENLRSMSSNTGLVKQFEVYITFLGLFAEAERDSPHHSLFPEYMKEWAVAHIDDLYEIQQVLIRKGESLIQFN